jgi:hypothetical protein
MVGTIQPYGPTKGFLYNGATFTAINDPLSVEGTFPSGVSGSDIVGSYNDSSGISHGFLYDGSTYTTLDDPLGVFGTEVNGISDGNIVGGYRDSSQAWHGFVLNGSTYTTLNVPSSWYDTTITGISGDNIVGTYEDASGRHGFIAAVPEPSTLVLLGVGAMGLGVYRWKKRKR